MLPYYCMHVLTCFCNSTCINILFHFVSLKRCIYTYTLLPSCDAHRHTVEPPNNAIIGTANFRRFSLLRGTNLLKSMQTVHWKNFIMRGFSLLGEFIIGGFTVHNNCPGQCSLERCGYR